MKKFRIPLLKDHHTHPCVYSSLSQCINLRTVRDKNEALSLLNKRADEISVIHGWNSSFYDFKEEDLDNLPPVVIVNLSFHSFLINKPARDILSSAHKEVISNISKTDWVERNLDKITKFIAGIIKSTPEQIKSFYDDFLLSKGIWYAEEMLLPDKKFVQMLLNSGYMKRTRIWADPELYHSLDTDKQKYIHGIKIFTDGALGAKTAAIHGHFLTGEKGIMIYTDKELEALLIKIMETGKPAAIHAIGDLANEQVVRILEKIKNEKGHILSVRMEHCQFITKETAIKAKKLGIVLSMQPNFSSDSTQYADRLPESFLINNNPFRMLIDEAGFIPGKDLIFGSDGMPHGVKYALEQSLFPPYKQQRLNMEEFIAGYCMPDKENGFIEVEIDEHQQKVSTRIIR